MLIGVGALYFCLGGAMAYALFSSPPPEDLELSIFLLGKKIDLARPPGPQIKASVRHYLAAPVTLGDGGSYERRFVPRDVGVSVDFDRLERTIETLAANKGDVAHFLAKHRQDTTGRIDLGLPIRIDDEMIQDFLLNLKYDYDRKPQSAKFDMDSRTITPHREGRQLLLDATIAKVELALKEGRTAVPMAVNISQPASVTDDLESVDISRVLGWYETPYCLMKKCWNRNNNLELGGKLLDGTIIGPGETFDFNEALGPRTEARGFLPAPTIEQGILTETPGGGTCQTASTLYAAAFFAGMDLVQRRAHSRPSGYILLGLDATVTYPNIDLVFRNPFNFPVVIHYKVADGKMTVELLGRERPRMVHFIRRITQTIPHQEKTVEEPEWPKGLSVVTQLGIDGFRVRRYRIVYEGSHVERELTETVYPPTTMVTHVGMNASIPLKDFVPPLAADDHTPYAADKRIRFYLDEKNEFQKIIASW